MKYRKEESPICSKENIPLFVMYIKKELSKEQERKLDKHIQSCSDCMAGFAYVEEILLLRQPLSADEKTLLLKYITDPLWYYSINCAKKQILGEVLNEVKELLKDSNSLNADTTSNLKADNNDKKAKDSTNNNDKLDIITNTKNTNKNTSQKHSYTVLTLIIAVFLILSSSIVLIATKHTPLESFLPFKSTISTPNITTNQQPSSLDNNLYQQLDIAIDEFLSTTNKDYLNKATSIAKDIEQKHQDKYGIDLVDYYKSVPSLAVEKLLVHRKKLTKLINQATGDDYKQRLEDSQNLERTFLALGDLIEAYKTKALINKLYVQLHNDEMAKLATEEGLRFSTDHSYLFLEADFLLWQAKHFSEIPDFVNAQESFLRVIELGNKLSINKLVTNAGTSLAFLYYNQDDNEKAFELTKKLLVNFTDYKNTQAITLLQLAGLTSFNLHYYEISNSYLKEAIKSSQEFNSPVFTSRSYAFLALTLSEQKNFNEADILYSKAEIEINNIKDETARLEALAWIVGYKAKLKLLESKYNEAIELYQNKLSIMDKIHLVNNLEFSQSNEAIAIALSALGQQENAQKYNAIAKNYQILAETNNQRANCLLALVPTNCSLKE